MDTERGTIYYANDNIPGYTGTEVRKLLEDRFHVPVTVENDVNAAALGEGKFGGGVGAEDFLCLTYGTGVGGAIVIGGEVCTGSSWSAGSFGGIVIIKTIRMPGKVPRPAVRAAKVLQNGIPDPECMKWRQLFYEFGTLCH